MVIAREAPAIGGMATGGCDGIVVVVAGKTPANGCVATESEAEGGMAAEGETVLTGRGAQVVVVVAGEAPANGGMVSGRVGGSGWVPLVPQDCMGTG